MNRDQAEAEAEAEATSLNRQIGEQGDDVSYYIAVESRPGEWQVEKHTDKKSWPKRIVDAFLDSPGP